MARVDGVSSLGILLDFIRPFIKIHTVEITSS